MLLMVSEPFKALPAAKALNVPLVVRLLAVIGAPPFQLSVPKTVVGPLMLLALEPLTLMVMPEPKFNCPPSVLLKFPPRQSTLPVPFISKLP